MIGNMRLLMLAAFVLLAAACGPEAPLRTTAQAPTAQPASLVAPTAALLSEQPSDPRALGDPRALITVIEYGDYQ